jgi:cyanophycin synthetase
MNQPQDMLARRINPLATITLNFEAIGSDSLTLLGAWLRECLDIREIEPFSPVFQSDHYSRNALEFLQFHLHLCRLFFQLGRLPVFDLPRLVSIELRDEEQQRYQAAVEVQAIGAVPGVVYQLVINSSLDLCRWMSENPISGPNRNKLYTTVQQKVIDPLLELVPSGKSTIPVLRTAHALGIPFIHLGLGIYQLGWGSRSRRMDRSVTDQDTAIGSKLAHDKFASAHFLRMAALPAPDHDKVGSEKAALGAAVRLGYPVVIKPADRDQGIGVTVDVFDEDALKIAFHYAQKLSAKRQVIVERQVPGVCHRLFIADGKLLYAVKRLPLSIYGDGKQTVKELVDAEVAAQNSLPPWKRSEIRPLDDLAETAIARAGFRLESVPEAGMPVPLRRIESTESGGVDEDVTNTIHPENCRIAIEAARLFGLHVAGIDIISTDISKPWFENGAIINEVNFAPLFGGGEISLHHIPLFFKDFIDGNGKIPVEIHETGQQLQAIERQRQLVDNGIACYLTNGVETIAPDGRVIHLKSLGLTARIRALLLNPDVDVIIAVSSSSADLRLEAYGTAGCSSLP